MLIDRVAVAPTVALTVLVAVPPADSRCGCSMASVLSIVGVHRRSYRGSVGGHSATSRVQSV